MSLTSVEIYGHTIYVDYEKFPDFENEVKHLLSTAVMFDWELVTNNSWGASTRWTGMWLCIEFYKKHSHSYPRFILQLHHTDKSNILCKIHIRDFGENYSLHNAIDIYHEENSVREKFEHMIKIL